jgi:hypothetical protein
MQNELTELGYDIFILGINEFGFEIANEQVTEERDIPWLQDQEDVLLWTNWDVQYRDVHIFDETQTLREVINLSQFDLNNPENYASFIHTLTTL